MLGVYCSTCSLLWWKFEHCNFFGFYSQPIMYILSGRPSPPKDQHHGDTVASKSVILHELYFVVLNELSERKGLWKWKKKAFAYLKNNQEKDNNTEYYQAHSKKDGRQTRSAWGRTECLKNGWFILYWYQIFATDTSKQSDKESGGIGFL